MSQVYIKKELIEIITNLIAMYSQTTFTVQSLFSVLLLWKNKTSNGSVGVVSAAERKSRRTRGDSVSYD